MALLGHINMVLPDVDFSFVCTKITMHFTHKCTSCEGKRSPGCPAVLLQLLLWALLEAGFINVGYKLQSMWP